MNQSEAIKIIKASDISDSNCMEIVNHIYDIDAEKRSLECELDDLSGKKADAEYKKELYGDVLEIIGLKHKDLKELSLGKAMQIKDKLAEIDL